MSNLHGVPKIYGMIFIIFGMVFFVPLIGFLIELIDDLYAGIGWSIIMFGIAIVAIIASILMIGFGTNIVVYHEKKDDDKTIDEKTNQSKFKPIPKRCPKCGEYLVSESEKQ